MKILYIPDYLSPEESRRKEFAALCELLDLLSEDWLCTYVDVDIRRPKDTDEIIRRYIEMKPDRVISSGIGGFFAVNYFGGVNRICLEALTGYTAVERRITSKVFHLYMRLFPDFAKEDHNARTYRWAIYSQDAIDKGYNDPSFFIKTVTMLNNEISLSDYKTRDTLIELLGKIKQREINKNKMASMGLSANYKQNAVIKHYSVYVNDSYSPMFHKLYKGVIVRVTAVDDNPQCCWFSIRTKKTKTCIIKSPGEKMKSIIFNDSEHNITCDFDSLGKIKCPHTLVFEPEVYDELKSSIPEFMEECGVKPNEVVESLSELRLMF